MNLPQEAPVLALLPGSRAAEVQYLVPRMFAAVSLLWRSHPSVQVLVPCVPTLRHTIAAHAAKAGLQHELGQRLHLLQGLSHAALAACDVTLIASGTATLEAALFKRPMVVVYNMHPISWWLTQRKRLQPWVGLPNILSNSFVVPELLQDQATPQAMASKLRDWFDDAPKREQTAQQFIQLHHQLKRDTVTLACDAIQAIL